MAGVELRPRRPTELVDAAVATCRRRFADLATATLVLTGPAIAVCWAVALVDLRALRWAGPLAAVPSAALAHAACVDVAGLDRMGSLLGWRSAVVRSAQRGPRLIVLWLRSAVLGVLGVIAGVVPGVRVGLRLVVAVPVMVLEGGTVRATVKRTRTVAFGQIGRTLGVLLVAVALLAAVVAVAAQVTSLAAVAGGGDEGLVLLLVAVAQVAVTVLGVPLLGAVAAELYVDARVRREGLDLSHLLVAAA